MNFTILLIYIIVGGLIQLVRALSNEWEWLGAITSNIPYFKGVTIALTIICILAGIFHQVKTEIDKKKYSVFVVPEHLNVSPGYSKPALIKIINNQDFPLFQVDLKISVEKGDLSVDDVKLNPKDDSKLKSELKSKNGGIIVSHDIFMLGVITKEGKRENHYIIYDIDAHSTKEFFAKINANDIRQKSKVVFQIVRTATEPADVFNYDPFHNCKEDDKDFKTYHETSKTMLNQRRYKEALVCCEKALIKNPNSYKAYNNMGIALLFLKEKDKAIEKFEKAIELDPTQPKPYLNLAGILLSERRFDDAILKLELVTKIKGPEQLDAYVLWGRCLALKNDLEGATEKFKKAIGLNSQFGEAYHWWGWMLKRNNDCEKAILKFQKATEYENSLKLDSYGLWGACLESMGKYQDAIDKYKAIIDLAPESQEAELSKNSIERASKKIQDRQAKQ